MKYLLALAGLLAGCQMAPTKIKESQEVEFSIVTQGARRPVHVTEKTVVLDTRSSFEFGLQHVRGSHHFPWAKLAENAETGEPLRDRRKAVQSLALLGIHPLAQVVVIGPEPEQSQGEAGRVAWELLRMGVGDVQTATLEPFRSLWTNRPTDPPANATLWEESPTAPSLVISKTDFLKALNQPRAQRSWIIDVRTPSSHPPRSGVISVPWTTMYTKTGRPDVELKRRLSKLGVESDDTIIVVSQRGVRSGAAAYALLALGYTRVLNFVGGWNSL